MTRKLATVQKIKELNPIEGADKIEVASVLGWKCVVLKGQFKVGQKIIYCEVDSFLPIKPEYEFLRKGCYKKLENGKEGFRIRTIRLRGQISQGLVLPLPEQLSGEDAGEDLTRDLGITLYQPPIPACLSGKIAGQFPAFIPKTDETRVQLLQDVLTRHKGIKCYITEKLDGSSATFFVKDGEFGVCSRNWQLLETEGNAFWQVARELKIEEKLKSLGKNICIQGELVGNGIQKNYLNIEGRTVTFFNAFDIDEYKYYNWKELKELMSDLDLVLVPVISEEYILSENIDEIIEMSKGNSQVNKETKREGIVIRPIEEKMDMQMSEGFGNGRLSFKAINPEYLLEEED